MLLYFVVLWIKKTFYSLPKLYFYISSKRDITVNELRQLEKLGYKTGKLKLDVRYLETCHDLEICPEFASIIYFVMGHWKINTNSLFYIRLCFVHNIISLPVVGNL